ncbi:MAG TPA: hypothetical protein PLX20_01275 [Rhodocyclaceae bacterium]|nr:hypothetical protein [Rhodocyclaceae bacterium]HMV53378.1 hypothetical protein [Rhodocyclaceae bacterium]HMZ83928.1 hypothetical protein [Rhodocyclaceae bacterium]HNB77645.1 hypothetical protein [Rhodocyclaceae bacterium]HNC61452.1 hypothetical protein [Rhodocyclaceae bacterium]
MRSRYKPSDRRLLAALSLSLLIHGALLALRIAPPAVQPRSLGGDSPERLDVALAPPTAPRQPPAAPPVEQAPPPKKAGKAARRENRPPRLAITRPEPSRPTTSDAEPVADAQARREALKQFLDEIKPVAPEGGVDLAHRAVDAARGIARGEIRAPQDDLPDAPFRTPRTARRENSVDPLALELYFESFVQKLNRSAAFVATDPRRRGADVAVVQVQLNQDGSLRNYRIVSAADQQVEIEYVRRVVERAAPFAGFPPEIRRQYESLTFEICIFPPRAGASGGFSRTSGSGSCRDQG